MKPIRQRTNSACNIGLIAAVVLLALMGILCAGVAADDAGPPLSNRSDKEQISTQLADILSDPRYTEDNETTLVLIRLLQAVLEPVAEFLDSLFGTRVRSLLENSPVLYWAVVATLFVLAVGIFAHILVVLANAFSESDDSDTSTPTTVDTEISSADILQAAQEAESRGEYTRATVLLYLATLRELDRQGRLRFSDSETNRRMVRQIDDQDLRSRLMEITDTVDAIIYGNRPGSRETYQQIAQIAGGVGVS